MLITVAWFSLINGLNFDTVVIIKLDMEITLFLRFCNGENQEAETETMIAH